MTDEMLALALANAEKAGAANVEFLKGTIEAIPVYAGVLDDSGAPQRHRDHDVRPVDAAGLLAACEEPLRLLAGPDRA